MKYLFIACFITFSYQLKAQELFVMTDPASNVPAGSIGVRDMNFFLYEENGTLNYHNMPEIMWGVSNKLMIRATAFISNSGDGWASRRRELIRKV